MDKTKDNCEICKKKLGGIFSSDHQCKRCLRTVCKDCCNRKKFIFTKNSIKFQQHRCCDACWPESERISQLIKQNGLVFNSMSLEGKEWSQLVEIDAYENKKNSKLIKIINCSIGIQDNWPTMTPSQREFLGHVINKTQLANVESAIKYVYEKMIAHLNHSQSPFLLISYLLCYCDSVNSVKVLNYLIHIAEAVDEDQIISNVQLLCQTQNNVSSKSLKQLFNYAKNAYKPFAFCYFLDCLCIDIVHHLIMETLLLGNPEILQLAISCIIVTFKQQILSDKFDQKSLKNHIWQNSNLKQLQKQIKILRKLILKKNGRPKNDQSLQSKQKAKTQKLKQLPRLSFTDQKVANIKDQKPILFQSIQNNEKVQQKSQNAKQEQILSKLKEAQQFMMKLEAGELNDQQMNPTDLEAMEQYLDHVIEENDKALKECEQFEDLLNQISSQLYVKDTINHDSELQIQK